jgi:cell wall-associated NlpC family hydrolase
LARSYLAAGIKIQYSKDKDKRNGPNSFDCSGFVAYVYQQLGLDMSKANGGAPTVSQITSKNGPFHEVVNVDDAKIGDLIVHLGEGDKHIGIYSRDEQGNVKEISAAVGGRLKRSKLDPSHPKFKSSITEYPPSEFGEDWTVYRWNK